MYQISLEGILRPVPKGQNYANIVQCATVIAALRLHDPTFSAKGYLPHQFVGNNGFLDRVYIDFGKVATFAEIEKYVDFAFQVNQTLKSLDHGTISLEVVVDRIK